MKTFYIASAALALLAFATPASAGQQVGEISELNNCIIIQVLGPNQYLTNCVPPASGGGFAGFEPREKPCYPHKNKRS